MEQPPNAEQPASRLSKLVDTLGLLGFFALFLSPIIALPPAIRSGSWPAVGRAVVAAFWLPFILFTAAFLAGWVAAWLERRSQARRDPTEKG